VHGAPARVTLQVRSQSGRLVRALAVGDLPAGANAVAWDGRDDQGRPVPAGTYRLAASADDGQAIARATLTVTLR
jgi:flagellar basal-body rod modification protein FlgD